MAEPIYVAPDMAHFELTPDKYAALLEAVKANKDASNLKDDGDGSATVTYDKIDFAWTYDAKNSLLTVVIVKDRNFAARLAGNQVIFDKLGTDLISTV